ncbi:RUN domain-containing protein 1 isoform X2 [Prorops nasuta]|uniref:RUN domain-containing protein 1 isoform X2 n=1 Tax=Prorops nasuta TaxID=863751 RepID=UPI0034CDF6D0
MQSFQKINMDLEQILSDKEINMEVPKTNLIDDIDNSDESDRPSGERWAPVGANDGDNDFGDEYKYIDNTENLSCDMERLKILEEEQEVLNSSLIALTTHFAQVQFRLQQIVEAPAHKKETLLKELEEFAFRGIPEVPSFTFQSRSTTPNLPISSGTSILEVGHDKEVESKMALHRSKQRELISQLKMQLEDLEKYAYETGSADLPQSVILERQNIIINHLKEKLNFNIDDLCKLPTDDLKWQMDYAISQIVSPLKMKEQLVIQLKTQITDLERFINYLQGESLLATIGNIIASHTPYKRSHDSHFKAFICAGLNSNKLVNWLKLVLQCQYLLENHYAPWSYVIKTGFQDAYHTLDRLTKYKFDLPIDLAVRQFQNIKDAF